jgi:hypothetical protein
MLDEDIQSDDPVRMLLGRASNQTSALSLEINRRLSVEVAVQGLFRRLRQGAQGGALLHLVRVTPGELGVGEKVAAPHIDVHIGVVDAGRHRGVLFGGAGGA